MHQYTILKGSNSNVDQFPRLVEVLISSPSASHGSVFN